MTSRRNTRKSLDDDDDSDNDDDEDYGIDDDEEDPYNMMNNDISIGEQQRESARKFLWDEDDEETNNNTMMDTTSSDGGFRDVWDNVGGVNHEVDISTNLSSAAYANDHGYGPSTKKKKQTYRRSVGGAAAIALGQRICGRGCRYLPVYLVIVLVIGIVYGVTLNSNSKAGDDKQVSSPNQPPATSPDIETPEDVATDFDNADEVEFEYQEDERYDSLLEMLEDGGHLGNHGIGNDQSPRHKALNWLSKQDSSQLPVDDPYVLTRYNLAVFWFTTNGKPAAHTPTDSVWTNSNGWMTESGYCSWYGIECVSKDSNGNGPILKLDLHENDLHGNIPREVFALSSLDTLDLSANSIGGNVQGGNYIAQLVDITQINFSKNSIMGNIPKEFGQLKQLRDLDLSENSFHSTIPHELSGATSLKALSVYKNELQGKLEDIPMLTALEVLYLDHNKIHGKIPSKWNQFTQMTDLQLRDMQLTGTIPGSVLEVMTNLKRFDITGNSIHGSLPDIFGNLYHLEEFHTLNNQMTGSIPDSFGALASLTSLNMAENQYTGTLPGSLGGMSSLQILKIEKNRLHKELPDVFGGMTALEVLKIDTNRFTGTIPFSLTAIPGIREIMIHDNKLTGTVATEFASLLELERLTIQSNNLSGTVPAELCSRKGIEELRFMSADCHAPKIECECCDECF